MTAAQSKMDDVLGFLNKPENQQKLYDSMMFLKIDNLEKQVQNIKDRLVQREQDPDFLVSKQDVYIPYKNRIYEREKIVSQSLDSWQICQKVVDRALEILNDWEDIDDIKIQTQYASVIIGKIDNLKKREIISSDDTRNKVCTLLRNVVRLNFLEGIFTNGQIAILKEGFSLVINKDIHKEELFLLNTKLRKAGLLTMPSWE